MLKKALFILASFPLFSQIVQTENPFNMEFMCIPRKQDQVYYMDKSGANWFLLDWYSNKKPIYARYLGKEYKIQPPTEFGSIASVIPKATSLWVCVFNVAQDDTEEMSLYTWDITDENSEWRRVGTFDGRHGNPSMVIPLSQEGHFLGLAHDNFDGFISEDEPTTSLVARFQLLGEKLQFKGGIKLGFDSKDNITYRTLRPPLPKKDNADVQEAIEDRILYKYMCQPVSPLLTSILFLPSIYQNHLAITAPYAGVVWVFDLDKGVLQHTYNLDKLYLEDLNKIKILNPLIHGTAFNIDGELIVAKHEPELVKMAIKMADDSRYKNDDKKLEEDFNFFFDNYNEIKWNIINLDSKTVNDFDASVGLIAKTPITNFFHFYFLVDPNGRIKTNEHGDWEVIKRQLFAIVSDKEENDIDKSVDAGKSGEAKK